MFNLPVILKDKYTVLPFSFGLLILIVGFSFAYVNFWDSQNLLAIHFDNFQGVDFFGKGSDIFDILITATIILLINFGLSNELYFKERFLSYLLAFATLIFTVLILIALNVIISIN
jgi:hypothetical protein